MNLNYTLNLFVRGGPHGLDSMGISKIVLKFVNSRMSYKSRIRKASAPRNGRRCAR